MDKVKILFVIISLFFLIGATGCEDLSSSRQDGKDRIDYSGSEGLVVSFNVLPKKVWKGEEFDVGLMVQNKGLVDVSNGKVCFSSMSSKLFGKSDGCKELIGGDVDKIETPLMGRLKDIDGEFRDYIFEGYELKEGYRKDSEYFLTGKVCYKGETRASPTACVRSVRYGEEAVCEAGELDITGSAIRGFDFGSRRGGIVSGKGQGGAVAVTSVYEDIIPRKEGGVRLMFEITVANVGGGQVVDLDKINDNENCNFDFRIGRSKVKIVASLFEGELLDCGDDVVNLGENGEGSVLCSGSVEVEKGDSFPLPLNIKLNYGYLSTVSGGFTIKKYDY